MQDTEDTCFPLPSIVKSCQEVSPSGSGGDLHGDNHLEVVVIM